MDVELVGNGYRVFPGGKERPGRDADPSPPSSAVGHERVELYLYSPYGRTACKEPQCLYKECTLRLPFTNLQSGVEGEINQTDILVY